MEVLCDIPDLIDSALFERPTCPGLPVESFLLSDTFRSNDFFRFTEPFRSSDFFLVKERFLSIPEVFVSFSRRIFRLSVGWI